MKKRAKREKCFKIKDIQKASILFSIVLVFIVLLSTKIKIPERTDVTSLQYAISGCDSSKGAGISSSSLYSENNYIILKQRLSYVCCANLTIDWEKNGYNIKIKEINTGEVCKCVCAYNVNARLGPLERGTYSVELYGVDYKGTGAELISKSRIEVNHQISECRTKRECVPAECCHAKSCVPASKSPSCKGILCTMECQPDTMDCGQGYCTCTEGRCEAAI